jgi:threonine/homoserine/homoserine lactone efflux protein
MMGEAIGQVLPAAAAVALSPMAIIAVVLMLVSRGGRSNALAFAFGWILGLAALGAVVLLVAAPVDASDDGRPATWVNWLHLLIGALLVLVAARQWRGRPEGVEQADMPKWMGALDGFTPVKACGLALLAGALNPKNGLIAISAAATVAQAGLSSGRQAVAWAIFVVIGTLGVGIPIGVYLVMGLRAADFLDGLKAWMVRNNAAIMAVLCLIIGVKSIGDAISGFSA